MPIDDGDIKGGFSRNYDAQILEQTSPLVLAINAAVGFRSWLMDVAVKHDRQENERVFTLEGRHDAYPNCLFTTPNENVLGIRCFGLGYAINTAGSAVPYQFHNVASLTAAVSDVGNRRLFMAFQTFIICLDEKRVKWTTRNLAMDQIEGLEFSDMIVRGVGYGISGEPVSFAIDSETGEVQSGWRSPVGVPILRADFRLDA